MELKAKKIDNLSTEEIENFLVVVLVEEDKYNAFILQYDGDNLKVVENQ